jgi:hypothetical protein
MPAGLCKQRAELGARIATDKGRPGQRGRRTINANLGDTIMPRGDKSKYTEKQKRRAEHIEEGYEERGVPEKVAASRAWATVNKMDGGGKKPGGSGQGQATNKEPAKRGGRIGGAASAARPKAARSASAKKAAITRKKNKNKHKTSA